MKVAPVFSCITRQNAGVLRAAYKNVHFLRPVIHIQLLTTKYHQVAEKEKGSGFDTHFNQTSCT